VGLQFLTLPFTTHLPEFFLLSANMTLVSTVHYSFLLFKYVERGKFQVEVNFTNKRLILQNFRPFLFLQPEPILLAELALLLFFRLLQVPAVPIHLSLSKEMTMLSTRNHNRKLQLEKLLYVKLQEQFQMKLQEPGSGLIVYFYLFLIFTYFLFLLISFLLISCFLLISFLLISLF